MCKCGSVEVWKGAGALLRWMGFGRATLHHSPAKVAPGQTLGKPRGDQHIHNAPPQVDDNDIGGQK